MDKEGKTHKIIQKLSRSNEFMTSILRIRSLGDVPKVGFKSRAENEKWYSNLEPMKSDDFYYAIELLLEEYKLSQNLYKHIEEYICFGDSYLNKIKNKNDICELAEFDEYDRVTSSADMYWGNSHRDFAKVFISGDASLTEVKNWLDINWSKIKESMGETKRFRKSTKIERNKRIKELHSKSYEELGLKKIDSYTKEAYIKKIIKEEFGDDMDVENIRNIKYK